MSSRLKKNYKNTGTIFETKNAFLLVQKRERKRKKKKKKNATTTKPLAVATKRFAAKSQSLYHFFYKKIKKNVGETVAFFAIL